ncbi:MAG: transcription-repair coupling factor [Nitrospirota bacterium]
MSGFYKKISDIISPLIKKIDGGEKEISVSGLTGSSKAFFLSLFWQHINSSLLIIVSSQERAEKFKDDLLFFLNLQNSHLINELFLFPPVTDIHDDILSSTDASVVQRIEVLYRLNNKNQMYSEITSAGNNDSGSIVIMPVLSALQGVLHNDILEKHIVNIEKDEVIDREMFIEILLSMGYSHLPIVNSIGEFSVRGGIIDIYTPSRELPIRIEFFDDIVESIRLFDLSTQRSISIIDEAVILPVTEKIGNKKGDINDYLPDDTILIFDEMTEIEKEFQDGYTDDSCSIQSSWEILKERQVIDLMSLKFMEDNGFHFHVESLTTIDMGIRRSPFSKIVSRLKKLREERVVIIASRTEEQLNRLKQLFAEYDIPVSEWKGEEGIGLSKGMVLPIFLTSGNLSSGFIFPEGNISFITDDEIFCRGVKYHPPKRSRPKKSLFFSDYTDIKLNDYVVHIDHGIGRYMGLQKIAVNGYEGDFLVIQYAGKDKIYVPVERLNLVQKYMGMDGSVPKVDRLGGQSWIKAKNKAERAIKEMTKELLDLYAAREVFEGFSFSADDYISKEFDASFEFEETPDQLRSIEEVKRDMENKKPMDRLVCGDVGYGKTEVALRASFKAVIDNKQVAVVVPTTLLSYQHLQTFSRRLSEWPVKVEMLSGFRTRKQQRSIIEELKKGKIDIVIGTHRLLQKDVEFKDLGLVIIDEEQRFGVTHKERLKQMRKNVDVLTLTATPIPRTLQMALTGIRNMSIIDTPPVDRLPIHTFISKYDKRIIREGILKELSREGQIFFIHNRIQSIERIGEFLRETVPEARITIAHGRMRKDQLEKVMFKFMNKEYDLLLSTNIIESGLDISSANTIFINRADKFGLADLYQLRGRVGRSGEQAYAYMLVPDGGITGEARERLQAIKDASELGSGFRIASKDLEIRGAGNMLGTTQSGHIAAIGLELYLQTIEKAVTEIKGERIDKEIEPILNLKASAFIPDSYIPDSCQRLSFYKWISSITKEEEIISVKEEIEDRYGSMPESLKRLLEIVEIKILAKCIGINKADKIDKAIIIVLDEDNKVKEDGIKFLMENSNRYKILSEYSFLIYLHDLKWDICYKRLKECFQGLLLYVQG